MEVKCGSALYSQRSRQAFSLPDCCCLKSFPVPADLQQRPYRYPDVPPSFVIKEGFFTGFMSRR